MLYIEHFNANSQTLTSKVRVFLDFMNSIAMWIQFEYFVMVNCDIYL